AVKLMSALLPVVEGSFDCNPYVHGSPTRKELTLARAATTKMTPMFCPLPALAAVDIGTTRPLLGATIILRGNDRGARELRRAFPQHRRVIEQARGLSQDLGQRFPGRRKTEHPTRKTHETSPPSASVSALQAARQAISELGAGANREALLTRADAIWKSSDGVKS
ncbi:hypothetical protein, partial [Aquicoccus porphyridii]|uniref:hypothetical protein n=1 Tax=Aquicoccus porphyridii TaxID=1852029 RepID=UPI001CAA8303